MVVVHGGGWLNGDKTKFRALTLELARRGYVTMAAGYRLGHEAKFPAGIEDCNAAVRYLRANAARLGVDPDRIDARIERMQEKGQLGLNRAQGKRPEQTGKAGENGKGFPFGNFGGEDVVDNS